MCLPPMVLTSCQAIPSSTLFSILQATLHAWQPMQRSRSYHIPYCFAMIECLLCGLHLGHAVIQLVRYPVGRQAGRGCVFRVLLEHLPERLKRRVDHGLIGRADRLEHVLVVAAGKILRPPAVLNPDRAGAYAVAQDHFYLDLAAV